MADHYLLPVGRGKGGKKWNGVEGFCLCYDSSIRLCNTLMILYPPPPPQMMAVNWQSIFYSFPFRFFWRLRLIPHNPPYPTPPPPPPAINYDCEVAFSVT